ncbi:alpha/beta hydrolase fold domain-containing protein [Alkalibacterium sp. f15]|uniref:alpha/beta hydrolase fold domain-containing protein n=1 Tax=Alkalibacterium sp. f15 TaxID=3414029 RepID=UPI003BF88A9E
MIDSYETMPKSTAQVKGMKVVTGNKQNIRGQILDEDLVYQRKNNKNLKIRMVYPQGYELKPPYPVLVHIQGSGWFKQDLNNILLDFNDIVRHGFVLAIVEYLPIPDAIFPSHIHDAKTAVRYLNTHAKELQLDMNNLFLSGDSSGGHTAAMCWATWQTAMLDNTTEPLPDIRACVDLYGVTDFEAITHQPSATDHTKATSPENLLLSDFIKGKKGAHINQASVNYYMDQHKPTIPLLIMHGNKDTVVPFEQSVLLYEACKNHQLEADFYCVDDADHGGSIFYTEEVIAIIRDFLTDHLN